MSENTDTLYSIMGGEQTVLKLVERFYFYMDTLPDAKPIRQMHDTDLSVTKEKLFKFFSGWLGGPNLYIEEFGHPMLRRRHFPFTIGMEEKEQWMRCMKRALNDVPLTEEIRQILINALEPLAAHMINQ